MSDFLEGLAKVLENTTEPLSIIAIGILVVVFIAVTFFTKSSQIVKVGAFIVIVAFVGLIIYSLSSPSDGSDTPVTSEVTDIGSSRTERKVEQPPVTKQYLVTVTVSSITVIDDSEYNAPGQVYFELEFDDNVYRIPEVGEITVDSGTTIDDVGFIKEFKVPEGKEVSLSFKGTELDSNYSDTPKDDLGKITPRKFTVSEGFTKQIHAESSKGNFNVNILIESDVFIETN